jgi:thiamine biosynthesis lipoprotein
MPLVAIPIDLTGGLPARPPADHIRHSLAGETMGTTWSAEYYAAPSCGGEEVRAALARELERLNAQMSHWREDSDLSRFNSVPAGTWVELPEEFFRVLETALAVWAETQGAFDPALGRTVDAWGFGPSRARTAPAPAGERARIQLAPGRAYQPGGVSLDLSAIAKGFAVDQLARLLDQPDISSALVEIGGELRARGVKPDAQPWWVAIERPPGESNFPEVRVALCGMSIASTGDYRRYFEHEGTRYSHTIDPRTGSPARHPIASVTVLHEECMLADAYATALAVMGPNGGIAFADASDLAAIFILREDNRRYGIRTSKLFQEMLDDSQ